MNIKNSSKKLEICCYSLLSCINAEQGGADRIELCGGRPEGGTTPSFGTVKSVLAQVQIPVYIMIRPRGGDFYFNRYERTAMLEDIAALKELNPGGFVIGALKPDGSLDLDTIEEQMAAIGNIPVTFHRAFDMCKDPEGAVTILADLGVQNILTSGLYQNAIDGVDNLKKYTEIAEGRINIMAGSGVNPKNILKIAEANVDAFHFTAKKEFKSEMIFRNELIHMGGDKSVDEFATYEADPQLVKEAKALIETL
jgi:copper homeostasis protein